MAVTKLGYCGEYTVSQINATIKGSTHLLTNLLRQKNFNDYCRAPPLLVLNMYDVFGSKSDIFVCWLTVPLMVLRKCYLSKIYDHEAMEIFQITKTEFLKF